MSFTTKISKSGYKLAYFTFFCWLVVFILLGCLGCSRPAATPSPTPSPLKREIGLQTLPLQEKWRVKSGMIEGYERPTLVSTHLGDILFANGEQLVLLDNESGQIIWQTNHKGSRHADSLVVDEERAYLTSDWRLSAYGLADGHLLWQTEQQADHRGYYLYLKEGLLLEYERPSVKAGDVIHTFDPKTGLKLDSQVYPAPDGYFLDILLEKVWLRMGQNELLATGWNSNNVLWRLRLGQWDKVRSPAVVDNFLVLTNGSVELDVLVVKLDTGEVLWAKPGFVSNPVVVKNTVYVIAKDASIRAYELTSGQELGSISIKPAQTNSQYTYALASSKKDSSLYVHYGDTGELIAFGRTASH